MSNVKLFMILVRYRYSCEMCMAWIYLAICFCKSSIGLCIGKAKAGMVHSVSEWTRGVRVKLWNPLRMRAIPECLRGAFTTRRYTNPRLPLFVG